ncbi:MAG: DoxX family protein [Chitinophagia bacterium]
MKTTKIIYWISTGIICLFSLGATQMNSQMAIEGANHLLIPRYLGIEASIGQLIGLVLLIVPAIPARFKEWAYVGYGIMYLTALNAHLAVGDAFIPYGLMAILFFGLLLTSYITFHKLQEAKK